jgi:hypothetical protein
VSEGTKDGGLTGNRRYRKVAETEPTMDWFKIKHTMILQVEESVWNDAYEGREGRWVCQWRDARPSDLTEQGGFYV